MKNYDYSEDPGAVEGRQLASRRQLAELLLSQSIAGGPVYSNKAGIARALQGLIAGMDMGQAEKGERDLAKRRSTEKREEMERIVAAAESPEGSPSRASLAKLLATSQNPGYSQAGLSMLMKGPGKLEWKETGDKLVGLDERGNVVREIPKGVSPDTKYTRETVSADTALTHGTPSAGAVLTDERTRAEGNANRGVTMRGQNLVDARAAEAAGSQKAPAGYQWAGDKLQPIPGGPADPATAAGKGQPTEDERRSAGLTVRLESALKTMKAIPDSAKPEIVGEAVRHWPLVGNEPMANAATSGPRQQVESAQLDALDAALTLATGAAYTKDQLKNLSKSYFPQLGDAPNTLVEKEARFKKIIESARIRAGRSKGDIDRVMGGGQPGGEWSIKPLGD